MLYVFDIVKLKVLNFVKYLGQRNEGLGLDNYTSSDYIYIVRHLVSI